MKKILWIGLLFGGGCCWGAVAPARAALMHRWTFDAGSLIDVVGHHRATAQGAVTATPDGKGIELAGGLKSRAAMIFEPYLLPDDGAPLTVEIWMTARDIQHWNEILAVGSGPQDYLVLGGSLAMSQAPFLGISGQKNTSGSLAPFKTGERCHLALVVLPRKEGGVVARLEKRDVVTGAVVGSVEVTAPNWTLPMLPQGKCYFGRSLFPADPDCGFRCDELRIWRAALTAEELTASVKAGPDHPPTGIRPGAADPAWAKRTALRELLKQDELLSDWLTQDAGVPAGATFPGTKKSFEKAFAKVGIQPKANEGLSACLARYRTACVARRAERLAPVKAKAKTWVYARHYVMGGAHYAYSEGISDAVYKPYTHWAPIGGGLYLATFTPDGLWRETPLLETAQGAFRDVDVSFDGKRILYAYRASWLEDDFHLYEMDLATRQVRQLTFGKGFADFEGCYLPDGRILFSSSRCSQIVDCWWTEVSTLFRIDADGQNMWRVTFDQVHDTFPTLCEDGTILYTRWEYNDRSQMFPQPLFRMAPDGTNARAVYGANSWYPTTLVHARSVGTGPFIFAVGTGHHTWQPGELLRIDPREGREEGVGVYELEPLRKAKPVREDIFRQTGRMAMYPYPVAEDSVVLSFLPEGWTQSNGNPQFRDFSAPFGFYWTDVTGARELLVSRRAGRAPCGRPIPVCTRQVFPRPSSVADESKKTGHVYVRDVYEGVSMKGVPRGSVKKLRVVEIDYRHVGIGMTFNRGRGGSGLSSTGPAIGGGTWDVKKVWGEVPVEDDGSVSFEAPARVPFYFQLVDAKGYVVQTMRSWTTLQPGETASCVGCHESANMAPPNIREAKGKVRTGLLKEPPRGFSFPRDVQPILDRRCVCCHNPKKNARIPDLTAAPVLDAVAKRNWTRSYVNLTHAKPSQAQGGYLGNSDHPGLNWINSGSEPTLLAPRCLGAGSSAWFTNRLEKAHCPALTDAERRTLALWVDLGVPFGGDYLEGAAWTPEERARWDAAEEKRARALKTFR
ncbi:MAG: hypothetical protein MJ249_05950 [Kiritimatiellae bacterium]|nr:hypothetical protein [Kiritimatiellia bacterium]